jgi:transposase
MVRRPVRIGLALLFGSGSSLSVLILSGPVWGMLDQMGGNLSRRCAYDGRSDTVQEVRLTALPNMEETPTMAKGIRYTSAQKKAMIAKARKLKAEGMSQDKVAKELGIHVNSLITWMKPQPATKSAKSAPKKVPSRKAKRSAGKPVRYTPAQKQAMRDKASAMLKQGASKLAIQKELGIAYATLTKLLKGAKAPKAGKKSARKTKMAAADPVAQMAEIRKRILDINNEVAQLGKEKAKLQNEMKAVYKRLGKEIMG